MEKNTTDQQNCVLLFIVFPLPVLPESPDVSSILTKWLSFFNITLVKFCTDWLKIIYKSSISNTEIEILLILNQNPSHF